MQLLQIEVEGEGRVRLSGEADVSTAPQLSQALLQLVAGGGDLVVDLFGVSFMDRAGLRPLISAARRLGDRGRVILRAPPKPVCRLFALLGADSFTNLEIVEGPASRTEADGSGSG